jgi:UDP:flavonoid glycosyltransferase YjiC (YdhE family)
MPVIIFAPETRYISETTRMIDIALALPEQFQCIFMSYGGQYEKLITEKGFPLHRLQPQMTESLSNRMFKIEHLDRLGYLVGEEDLEIRLHNEVALFKQYQPCCVVTGFIHSTAISTQLFGIPLLWVTPATLTKPYFDAGLGTWPDVLDYPVIRMLPDRLLNWLTNQLTTSSAALFRPFNKQCKKLKLRRFKSLPHMLETGYTLLSDIPEFTGITNLPDSYHYIGPFITRLDGPIPPEIEALPRDLPLIYFAMGSSGKPAIVKEILEGFGGKPYRVIAPVKHLLEGKRAGADYYDQIPDSDLSDTPSSGDLPPQMGRRINERNPNLAEQIAGELMQQKLFNVRIPKNVLVTDWLPAHLVNPLAAVSVIHGGQGTVYNALASGTPVVGVGMQPEQEGNLECLVRHGVGIRIKKKRVTAQAVLEAVDKMLANPEAKRKAVALQYLVNRMDGPKGSAQFIVDRFL